MADPMACDLVDSRDVCLVGLMVDMMVMRKDYLMVDLKAEWMVVC